MSASGQSKQLFNDISKINEDESFNGAGNFDPSMMNSDVIKRREAQAQLNRSSITEK